MFNYKAKYIKDKAERDELTYEHSLWKRLEGQNLNEEQVTFLQHCMTENLNHARHVENERLTFNTVFLALVAGALAFASEFNNDIAFYIYLAITLAGFLSMLLTSRWNNAFSRHIFYAQQCYKLIHIHYFGDAGSTLTAKERKWEALDYFNDVPLYCFEIYSPIAYTSLGKLLFKARTRILYNGFYLIVQILLIACTLMAYFDII